MEKLELVQQLEEHLLNDKKPSIYLDEIKNKGLLDISPLDILPKLDKVPQEQKHHPEGSVWNHTLMVVDQAAKYKHLSKDPRAFMWAALLHDVGKEKTTLKRNGRWTSYDHDRVGGEMTRRIIREISDDQAFNEKVISLVRFHMQYLYVTKRLPFGDIPAMIESSVDINDVALLSLCDRLGRGELNEEKKKEILMNINDFINKISLKTGENYKKVAILT
jgi:putative nucleotidyltransferase with HDIG domain